MCWFLVLFLFLRTFVIEGYEVQGPSMVPTLEDRQRILVFKLPHIVSQLSLFSSMTPFDEGDIVVFQSPDDFNKRYVKRVIAHGPPRDRGNTVIAGEVTGESEAGIPVEIVDGVVYVNSRRVSEDYLNGPPPPEHVDRVMLKPGTFFVMGDNRAISKDSRSFGPVDDSYMIGRAVLRFWPLSAFGLL